MPRKKRSWRPNMCHHVMLRGIDGRAIFSDDGDRCRFCLLVQEASELHGFRVHAFCLMTNHVHLIIEPVEQSLASGVQRFVARYAQQFNKRLKRKGYVFQGRFLSLLVQDGVYMRRLIRYIHLNPLEAGLAKTPDDYRWSSHNAYFGREAFTWLETDRVLSYFANCRSDALSKLAAYMNAKADAGQDVDAIQEAARLGSYGSEEFTRIFAVNRTTEHNKGSTTDLASLQDLVATVCDRYGVCIDELRGTEKSRHVVDARSVLARMCLRSADLTLRDACRVMEKPRSSASRLAARASKHPQLRDAVDQLLTIQMAPES